MMSSWQIFRQMIIFWNAMDNPIFWHKMFRPSVWNRVVEWVSVRTDISLILGGISCYLLALLAFSTHNPLVVLIPVLLVWLLMTCLALAPTIVYEREHQTWDVLRMIPMETQNIVIAKASVGLWWLRGPMRIMSSGLMLISAGVGLGSMMMIDPPIKKIAEFGALPMCGFVILFPIVAAAVFVMDRAQQYILIATSILTVSASTRSSRSAQAAAGAIILMLWLVEIAAGAGLILVMSEQRGQMASYLITLITLGPAVGFVQALSPELSLLLIAVTLLFREGVVRLLWHQMIRRAEAV